MRHIIQSISFFTLLIFISSFSIPNIVASKTNNYNSIEKDSILSDSLPTDSSFISYILYKENVYASYYHDKFIGRRTASGTLFNNDLLTAAHKTLKFGTKVRVTNTLNDSSIVVVINDRGPFTKGRDIDLSKKAFMKIAKNNLHGALTVRLEIIEEKLNPDIVQNSPE